MTDHDLMSIGAFARRTGLTSSALRFYDDAGLLPPSHVDPRSGYRYYAEEQVPRAGLLREMREIAMPLRVLRQVLASPPEEAGVLIDAHVSRMVGEALAARAWASAIKASLRAGTVFPVLRFRGPVLADAVEQVLTATGRDPGIEVLAGVHLAVDDSGISLTATDRYRLTRRTLVAEQSPPVTWAGTLDGDQLRSLSHELRRNLEVEVVLGDDEVVFRPSPASSGHSCHILDTTYPDFQLMLDSLAGVRARVLVARHELLRAVEQVPHPQITLSTSADALTVGSGSAPGDGPRLPAEVDGPPATVSFETTQLHPAISSALGPEVILELRDPAQPMTVRSADRGDLTTILMPVSTSRHP